ncbi:3197_t:CDS:2 [Cetraspora pellucida]|uniref:3197_t:CDS:1 n=1 Tax=Cetraspora pellucida TaxID=1433469 RepID=A0ACA9K7E1_9GLOM|nr:3197_t:CDS:2 [Cetraspora pellucida]
MTVIIGEEKVSLVHSSGSSAEVYFFGATVTSWKCGGKERSKLDGTKAIRGGIPLGNINAHSLFVKLIKASDPSAETANLPQHGIVRVSTWKWSGTDADNDEVTVRFKLTDSEVPENLHEKWPKKFELIFIVTLTANTLKNTFQVTNQGTEPFTFNALLHTYYSVPDISKVSIKGLNDITYIDKVANFARVPDVKDSITIDRETDRIYENVLRDEFLIDLGQPGGYKNMVCVEPGTVTEYVTLEAGKSWECGQILKVQL